MTSPFRSAAGVATGCSPVTPSLVFVLDVSIVVLLV